MRAVVSFLMGVATSLYALYFAIPLLYTAKTGSLSLLNQTDPTIAQSITMGNGFYSVLPLIPIFVGAFLVISYSLRRDPGE